MIVYHQNNVGAFAGNFTTYWIGQFLLQQRILVHFVEAWQPSQPAEGIWVDKQSVNGDREGSQPSSGAWVKKQEV